MSILNRAQSIRLFCVDCVAGELGEIKNCQETKCQLHPMRMGISPDSFKGMDKSKAIASFCQDCLGSKWVKRCGVRDCSLYPFRTGIRTEYHAIGDVFTMHVYVRPDGSKAYGMEELRKQHKQEAET